MTRNNGRALTRWVMVAVLALVLMTSTGSATPARARADSGVTPPLTVVATVKTGVGAGPLALDSVGRRLFVANQRAGSVSVVNLDAGQVVGEWPVGTGITEIAYDPTMRRVYVSEGDFYTPNVLRALDVDTGLEVGAISTRLRVGSMAVDPSRRRLLVTGGLSNAGGLGYPYLLVIDTGSFKLVANQFVGVNDSSGIGIEAIDLCAHQIYTLFSVRTWGTSIRVFDTDGVQSIEPETKVGGNGDLVNGLAIDFQRQRSIVSAVYGDARQASVWVVESHARVTPPSAGRVAIDESSGIAYVTSSALGNMQQTGELRGSLYAVDFDVPTIVGAVDVGRGPHQIVVDAADSRAYVSNGTDGTVTIVRGIQPPGSSPQSRC